MKPFSLFLCAVLLLTSFTPSYAQAKMEVDRQQGAASAYFQDYSFFTSLPGSEGNLFASVEKAFISQAFIIF